MIDKRWVLTALVLLTLVVSGLVAAVVLNSADVELAIGRAGIITAASAGPIGVLILMLQVGNVERTLTDVQGKVNGHLEAHVGHTDQQVRQLIDERLIELAQEQTTIKAPPAGPS